VIPSFDARVDPELLPGLQVYRALGFDAGSIDADGARELRGRWDVWMRGALAAYTPPPGVEVLDVQVPGASGGPDIPLHLLRPRSAGDSLPCLVHLHGGGLFLGSPKDDDRLLARYADELQCVVVSVGYRLAPEHSYGDAVEDCWAAFAWVAAHAADLAVDPARIAVIGFSAGGGLAAATALVAAQRGGPPACLQVLIAPMLEDEETASSRAMAGIPSWSHEHNRGAWRLAVDGDDRRFRWPYTARRHRAAQLSGLPPAFVQVGELEVFRDESIAYASDLMDAGVAAELHVYPAAFHGWESMVPGAAVSRRSRAERIELLRRTFEQPRSS